MKLKKYNRNLYTAIIMILLIAIFASVRLVREYGDHVVNYISDVLTQDIQGELEKEREIREELERELAKLQDSTDTAIELAVEAQGSLSDVVDYWRPISTYIYCEFVDSSGSGSGTVYQGPDDQILIYTNKHVVSSNGYGPNSCLFRLPEDDKIYFIDNSNVRVSAYGYDWGYIEVQDPLKHSEFISTNYSTCNQKPDLGDEIVILGYPTIGDSDDVTVTTGVISGFDDNYYITDAKIDAGNSGGTAIHIKNNCWLGIPTFASVGSVESLGRILSLDVVFE